MKTCTKCGIEKPLTEFNKGKRYKDGHQERCRACFSAYNKARYTADPERYKTAASEYYLTNREACSARNRDYGEKHKDHLREWAKGWAVENAERIRAYKQEHYRTRQEWYQQYREENRQKRAIYEATRRARKAASEGNFTLEEWQAKCEEFDYCCYLCGVPLTEETAVMEHVIPLSRDGAHTIDNINPSCAPCNNRKHDRTYDEYIAKLAKSLL